MIEIQFACSADKLPDADCFRRWAKATLVGESLDAEMTIRLVDPEESAKLNMAFRDHQDPTNVLSFPMQLPSEIPINLLGDLVICADVVDKEAQQQNKSLEAHCAHMVVHGILHLLGFDHVDEKDAQKMEVEEIRVMESLGFSNPYQEVVSL